jgi:flavorubredoxin
MYTKLLARRQNHMDSLKVFDDLYRFSTYLDFVDLTFHQYLLLGKEPLLIHTGSRDLTEEMIPLLKEKLKEKSLAYVFISHFESDECGGLSILKEHFPQVKAICSPITARQLFGFGYTGEIIAKKPGETLETDGFKLKFLAYPSEMHLWEGLLALEENNQLLFSSDLFIRFGKLTDTIEKVDWNNEIDHITPVQVPSPEALKKLQDTLRGLSVQYVIPGHGPCLSVS